MVWIAYLSVISYGKTCFPEILWKKSGTKIICVCRSLTPNRRKMLRKNCQLIIYCFPIIVGFSESYSEFIVFMVGDIYKKSVPNKVSQKSINKCALSSEKKSVIQHEKSSHINWILSFNLKIKNSLAVITSFYPYRIVYHSMRMKSLKILSPLNVKIFAFNVKRYTWN